MAQGYYPGGLPPLPFVVGLEGAGHVVEADVYAPPETPVWWQAPGAAATHAVVPDERVVPLPEEAELIVVAGLGIAGIAALVPLEQLARLRSGESALVLGVTGSVGRLGVQVARVLGAGRIVAAGRDAATLEELRPLGADESVVLSEGAGWRAAFRAASGSGGFDVVLDPVWGPPAAAAMGAMAPNGRLVTVGVKAGTEATFGMEILSGGLTVVGFDAGRCGAEAWTAAFRRLVGYLVAGQLELPMETVPLETSPPPGSVRRAHRAESSFSCPSAITRSGRRAMRRTRIVATSIHSWILGSVPDGPGRKRPKVGNLLALAVLSYLSQGPMHPYELGRVLREHGDARSIKFNHGSLYMVFQQLAKAGFVVEQETTRSGQRPERTVYAITDSGRQEMRDWLRELIEEPRHEYPHFVAALSLIAALPPDDVVGLLTNRVHRLAAERDETRRLIADTLAVGVHSLFLVEEDYRLALLDAETASRGLHRTHHAPPDGLGAPWREFHGVQRATEGGQEQ